LRVLSKDVDQYRYRPKKQIIAKVKGEKNGKNPNTSNKIIKNAPTVRRWQKNMIYQATGIKI
jgi:hypothetical protein